MIFLIDCNNFYASTERVFCPAMRHRPVVVLSNNDGCVIARSEEAKTAGIKMGQVAHLSEREFLEKGIEVFSSNYTLYHSISTRVMKIISELAPEVEFYSIDEAFADFSGTKYLNLYRIARWLRARILREVGIPVTIGIGRTRTLAKMANRFAKKERRALGVYYLDHPDKEEMVLKYTKVEDVWGIGRQYSNMLNLHGVMTAWDLTTMPTDWVQTKMAVVGKRLVTELLGTPCADLEIVAPAKKTIGMAKSFGKLLTEYSEIQEALANYVAAVAVKLRKQDGCARSVYVFVTTNPFRNEPQYSRSIEIQLPVATSSTLELLKYATKGLIAIFRKGYKYKKVGIFLNNLIASSAIQGSFFDKVDRTKQDLLMASLDKINKSFQGREVVKFASQGNKKSWGLRQQKVSAKYTTRLNEVITLT